MRLSRWMRTHAVSDQDLAKAIGVDRSTIWRIRNGKTRPTLSVAVAIEQYTQGAVDAVRDHG